MDAVVVLLALKYLEPTLNCLTTQGARVASLFQDSAAVGAKVRVVTRLEDHCSQSRPEANSTGWASMLGCRLFLIDGAI